MSIRLNVKIECQAKTSAFIIWRDRKENFRSSHPCHLINPCKPSKVSKNVSEKVNGILTVFPGKIWARENTGNVIMIVIKMEKYR